ncbi:hypothetical protein QGN23_06920 [Chryseobacterium gotjawalense]|uniref:Lipoprotein n=1 Tax=Chryseobacterium gotjawalense TaxID=3042315 RepID=A0ABY8RI33_9FLAO|nr:hypothetical protein [Chryseobacterium sp. wdc7]WHF53003.1 hypothetical protein QGN23_06920 [Chryseobacterium sp. wdc7]
MIYKTLVSSLTFFTLATCQSHNAANSTKTTAVENTEVITNTNSQPVPKKEASAMSTVVPPDDRPVKIAEKQQAISNKKNVVYFKEGENKFLKEYEMNVTFKRMLEDSRCPKDVQCIWAGNAMAEIEVMGLYTRPVILQLSTMNDVNRSYYNTQSFNGYKILLVEVSPDITSVKGFKALKGSYTIALQFEKEASGDSPTQKGGTTTK